MVNWTARFATRAARLTASEIRELLKLLEQPDIISFAGGIPDPGVFPIDILADAHRRILGDSARAAAALQYSASEGYPPLRQWIADRLAAEGLRCTADQVLITSGSQQALDFLAKLFISPGDQVLVPFPTYLGALQAFSAYEAEFAPLRVEGARRDTNRRAALGYVMPDFANPTGDSLDLKARQALLAEAEHNQLPLVEDGAYRTLRYDGETLPSLLALGGDIEAGCVIHCGSFSKTVVPGLRLGWVVAPRAVIQRLVLIKQAADLHTATLSQMVMLEVVAALSHDHLAAIRALYRARRDAMLEALARELPEGVGWTRPEGGMFIWLTLPPVLDGAVLLERAIAEERVAFVPGRAFHADRSGGNTLRLNFSRPSEAAIAEGIGRLGRLMRRMLGHP